MGCMTSSRDDDGRGRRDSEITCTSINEDLKQEQVKRLMDFRVLILGCGESGKSTIMKQLSNQSSGVESTTFGDVVVRQSVNTLFENVFQSLGSLIECAEEDSKDRIDWGEYRACVTAAPRLATGTALKGGVFEDSGDEEDEGESGPEFVDLEAGEMAKAIKGLLAMKLIQRARKLKRKNWMLENFEYLIKNLERIIKMHKTLEEGTAPTEDFTNDDYMNARERTTGIKTKKHTVMLSDKDKLCVCGKELDMLTVTTIDVGGQRSERRKWASLFDDSRAILYVCNAAGFRKCLFEDATVSRMSESLKVFTALVEERSLISVPVYLVLNKVDLLKQELEENPGDEGLDLSSCKGVSTGYAAFVKAHNLEESLPVAKAIEYLKHCFDEIATKAATEKKPGSRRGLTKTFVMSALDEKVAMDFFEQFKSSMWNTEKKGVTSKINFILRPTKLAA